MSISTSIIGAGPVATHRRRCGEPVVGQYPGELLTDERLDRPAAALRILAKLTELEGDPFGFNTTALVPQPDRRRLRVGDHGVVYTIDNGGLAIWAVHVEHRSTAYDT
ncbi:type II toxin-antitoxin system RelE/ParE family toxin [Streptomyces sp. NPDC056844]|uniref:type II toxin-antitoxin system RelE family toxin n=1 Tax=unclassified Streptomyces TaxID=2593676 RepID=UPI0036CCDBA3